MSSRQVLCPGATALVVPIMGCGYSLVTEGLPGMQMVLSLIPGSDKVNSYLYDNGLIISFS